MFDSQARQLDLLASDQGARPSAGIANPLDLGRGAWIDFEANWLGGADHWFDELAEHGSWKADRRPMYDRIVDVPRLIWYDDRDAVFNVVPGLCDVHAALEERYKMALPSVSANWYRDGSDSVAPHADKVTTPEAAHVAIVSFGDRRPFTLSEVEGDRRMRFELGHGDLITMGGSTQAHWRHGVPKVKAVGPRISVMFRDGSPQI